MALGSKLILEQSDSTHNSPVEPGKLRVLTDSKELWLDTDDGKRIPISDLLYRLSWGEGDAFVAPLPKKFYHCGADLYFSDVYAKPRQLAYQEELDQRVPRGTILPFIDFMNDSLEGRQLCPDGWVVCNGMMLYDPTQPAPEYETSPYPSQFAGKSILHYDGILESHIPDIAADTTVDVYSSTVYLPNANPGPGEDAITEEWMYFKQTRRLASAGVYPETGFVPEALEQSDKFIGPTGVLAHADLADDMSAPEIVALNTQIATWRNRLLAELENAQGYRVAYYRYQEKTGYVTWKPCLSATAHYSASTLYTLPDETNMALNWDPNDPNGGWNPDALVHFYTNTSCTTPYAYGEGLGDICEVLPSPGRYGHMSHVATVFVAAPDFRGHFPMGVYAQEDLGRRFEPTLPNITGEMNNPFAINVNSTASSEYINKRLEATGAFMDTPGSFNNYYARGSNSTTYSRLGFDASRSNPIYQDGATVRPPSFGVHWIIKV